IQQRILFHPLLHQPSQPYFPQVHITLQPLTDAPPYQKASNLLLQPHSIFPTTFPSEALNHPLHFIQSQPTIHLTHHHLPHLTQTHHNQPIHQYFQTHPLKHFKLQHTHQPLIRIPLFHPHENTSTFL
ncbi:condensation domain-containing protein, partial [Bacillus sp. WP8]|uniref:condensation domain-containing protein n=1 Tax=Bacillus sp. WP8 TaxID=756828 RepID=UPI0011A9576B